MVFKPCEIIKIIQQNKQPIYPYTLHNADLKSIKNAKYLRATIII